MRGRKPIPLTLKLLRGNPGHRPLRTDTPQPDPAIPSIPAHLAGEAIVEWERLTRELSAVGLVTNLDRAALAGLCVAWGRWAEAEAKLAELGVVVKSPSGYPIQNPYLAVANTALAQLAKLAVEFGLTPSARSRVHVAPTQAERRA